MGRLHYDGSADPVLIDDVELAHLKVVLAAKLRRHESFMMTWHPEGGGPPGKATIWIHPAIPLQLFFDSAATPEIDPHHVEEIMHALNSTGELVLDHLLAKKA